MRRTLLLPFAAMVVLGACGRWHASQDPVPVTLITAANQGARVRLTTDDGDRFVLDDIRVVDDSLTGFAGDSGRSVPIETVSVVETWQRDELRSALMMTVAGVSTALALGGGIGLLFAQF